MDRVLVTTLDEILRQNVADMAGPLITRKGKSRLFYLENTKEEVYGVLAPYDSAQQKAELVVMARIVDGKVLIEFDKSMPSLYDRLLEAGVPDEQICLAWEEHT